MTASAQPARASRDRRRGWAALAGAVALGLGIGVPVPSAVAAPPAAGRATAYPGGNWEPGPARFGAQVVAGVPLAMDDGVILQASLAYPTDRRSGKRAAGPFPVIIEHTPYVAAATKPKTYFAEHGYIYLAVQARGTGASGGELQRFSPRDAADGKALVDWAARRLEGSDGRVALVGCSYPAVMALNTAARVDRNSPVKAVVAACAGLNLNRATLMVAGMPTTSFWNFLERGHRSMGSTPAADRFYRRIEADMKAGGEVAYERAFWLERANLALVRSIAANGMPVLLWSGWRDTNNAVALRTFTGLQNGHSKRPYGAALRPGQALTPRYQIIMGDWRHGEGLDHGIFLQWLETWVRGVDTGLQATATPMHFFEPGTDRWVNLARFPAASSYTEWRLAAAGRLVAGRAPAGRDRIRLGNPAQPGTRLAFTTPPLTAGATLSGPISATIHASSSNTNLLLIAKLYDQAPDGRSTLFSTGVVLGSQHRPDPALSWTDARGRMIWPWPRLLRDNYLQPGRVYRFAIPLEPMHRAILPGHRLRLELTTQTPTDICPLDAVPAADNNDVCRMTAPQSATLPGGIYTIFYGAGRPSTLNLPQLQFRAFATAASGPAPTPSRPEPKVTIPLDWGR